MTAGSRASANMRDNTTMNSARGILQVSQTVITLISLHLDILVKTTTDSGELTCIHSPPHTHNTMIRSILTQPHPHPAPSVPFLVPSCFTVQWIHYPKTDVQWRIAMHEHNRFDDRRFVESMDDGVICHIHQFWILCASTAKLCHHCIHSST